MYQHNLSLLERIARRVGDRLPNYSSDKDRKPYTRNFKPRECRSCGTKYPLGSLCGYCWAWVRDRRTQLREERARCRQAK